MRVVLNVVVDVSEKWTGKRDQSRLCGELFLGKPAGKRSTIVNGVTVRSYHRVSGSAKVTPQYRSMRHNPAFASEILNRGTHAVDPTVLEHRFRYALKVVVPVI